MAETSPLAIGRNQGFSDLRSPVAAVVVVVGAAGSLSSLLWRRQPGFDFVNVVYEVAIVTTVAIVQPICTFQTTCHCGNASEPETA